MAIKNMKPTTPAQRGMTSQDFSMVTTKKAVRSLLKIKKTTAGRNNTGRITTRHRGGGVKQFYRLVNHQLAPGTEATIEAI
ncbi:MAG TPA: 50S ribosomal protein L2, partial [Candidatus Saccharimonadales bacterium]|nr:50S ribosomal protein L2 [Candidatus Saccharimonadales bacterium]